MRAIVLSLVLFGCGKAADPAPCADTTEPPVPAAEVCAHLADLGCRFEPNGSEMDAGELVDPCLDGYADWAAAVAPEEFARVTHCYLGASSCEVVDGCNRTCGADDGPVWVRDAGTGGTDAGPAGDAGPASDAGPAPDAGPSVDSGPAPDAGPSLDSGIGTDAGP